jgi:uncharacterized protein
MSKNLDKLLTASKLKNWLACNYTTINEINKKELKKKESSITEEIRKKRGDEFEEKIYKKLIKQYPKHIKIKKDDDRFEKTKEALRKGYDLIHKAYFKYEGWVGEIDFLIKDKNKKSKLGSWGYEVYDTKLSSFAKPEHIIQISSYSEWIEKEQGEQPPDFMYLILGNVDVKKENWEKKNKYKTRDYQLYFQKHKENYLRFLKSDTLKKNTQPERCSFCALCEWADVCEKKWEDEDHLNQIANIRKDQIKKIEKHGIKTLKQFSKLKETEKIKELNSSIFKKHLSQAKLLIKSKDTRKPEHELLPLKNGRGFNKLPKSSANEQDLFFDIEGLDKILNPEETNNDKSGLEYLFGIYNHANKEEPYKFFWAHNQNEEKKQFIELLNFIEKHLKKYPDAHIYHFNHYEKTVLTKLMTKHDSNIGQVNDLLREGKLVDLHKVVTQGMQVSVREYSLKNLEKFYGFERKGEIQNANESTDKYLDWIETEDDKLLEEIKTYNREDCESTYALREWLLKRRPQEASWAIAKEPEERKKNWEKENEDYKKLIDKVHKNSKIKNILSDILGFHKREDMVYWQDMFSRAANKNDEDLIEDAKCIGNMEKIKKELDENDKTGLEKIYTYKFSKQDFKVKENENVLNALEGDLDKNKVGKVLKIDESRNDESIIKISSKDELLPKVLSIVKSGFVNPAPIIKAIRRFVDSSLKDEKKYKATYEILNKNYPKIKNIKEGENIIKDKDFLDEALKTVEAMDKTYLYFQGPPGVGKTHTAAFIIIELLKKSKKIGITANSHKVIFNLLKKIEELTVNEKNKNFSFKGVHKAGSSPDKRFTDGKFIKNISGRVKVAPKKYEDAMDLEFKNLSADLFSGTAWCFSRPACDEKLDYIFIDEAGQLSIADIVAISLSAKNVAIIGDQMQLGSPTSAVHPGDSGKSIPEFLLENQDTISPDKGIFIDKSRRLHPNICNFISENFYDGRLKNLDFTEKRKIIFSKKESLLPETGIVMVDAKHKEICRQKSTEEGKLIKDFYNRIIGSTFIDPEENIKKKMGVEDILIVAPFNVQVNYLKSILPKEARVGTIDIFQGQEAPVTIISMTTSDPESLPRNVDFFFSRNRLNVAISRSQCLSIVIMNKKILEINCRKIEHIRLVNTFMKLLEYEKTINETKM